MQFLQIGSTMACCIKSENNSAKGILNLLEFSHIVFIHTVKVGNCGSQFDY